MRKTSACVRLTVFLSLGFILSSLFYFVPLAISQESLSGEILSVDPVEKTIVMKYLINPQGQEYEAELFYSSDQTRITKKGAESDLNGVKVGDKGSASFQDTSGKKTLVSLDIN